MIKTTFLESVGKEETWELSSIVENCHLEDGLNSFILASKIRRTFCEDGTLFL